MIGILVSRQWKGAASLSNALCEKGVNAVRTSDLDTRHDVVIRWGCSSAMRCAEPNIVYNPSRGITIASQKYDAICAFREANIPTLTVMDCEEVMQSEAFPIIGRKGVHYRGNGFWLCLQQQDVISSIIDGADYWTPMVPIEREWRVNTFVDTEAGISRTLCYEKMPPVRSAMARGTRLPLWQWIRNSKNGWTFRHDSEPPSEIRRIAKNAVSSLGLNLGGVDVALSNGEYFVIEVNTAPGIGKYTAKWYANRIINALKRRGVIEGG